MNDSQKIKQYIKDKDNSVEKFTAEMTFIVNAMHSKNVKDNDLIEIRDGYMTAKTMNSECIIMQAGPYFWRYREVINSGNLNKLLDSDFKEEITEIQGVLPESSSFDKVQIIMGKIKRIWHLFMPNEQEIIKKKFKLMVAHYATYLGSCKKIRELQ